MPEIGEVRQGFEIGYKTHPKRIWSACIDCGKKRWVKFINDEAIHFLCRSCAGKRRGMKNGNQHPNWKGGITYQCGYRVVKVEPDDFFFSMTNAKGYVFEHRLVVAKAIGRCLHSWEIVHHKHNKYPAGSIEDKRDNRYPENLQLVTDDRHRQITLLERKIKRQSDIIKQLKRELACNEQWRKELKGR